MDEFGIERTWFGVEVVLLMGPPKHYRFHADRMTWGQVTDLTKQFGILVGDFLHDKMGVRGDRERERIEYHVGDLHTWE